MVGENGERQLRGAASAVSPLESGRTVISQVQPEIEWLAVYGDLGAVPSPSALVALHAMSSKVSSRSSADRCSGCVPGLSNTCTLTKQNLDNRQAMSSRP